MATVFDVGLMSQFSVIFVWLFIFTLVYAVLQVTKVLGANKGLDAMIAITIAFFFSLSSELSEVISTMTPWFVIFIMFIFFVWMIGMFMGMEQTELTNVFGKGGGAFWWIFSFALIILIYAVSKVFGQKLLEGGGAANATSTGFAANVMSTIFNPQLLGMALLLIIASFVVRFMATND